MATSQRDLSATVRGGSDELFDFYCQPCSTENLHVEAAVFCQQCQEYLCDDCCRYHRKFANSKNHLILDKETMPKTTITPRVRDTLIETCPKHAGKVLEYFCNDHDEICCSVCLNLTHSSCKNKSYIPDISNGTLASRDYNDLVEKLDRLVMVATGEQAQIKLNDKDNEECRTKALDNIKQCKKELDKIVGQIVDEAVQNVTRLHKANADEIKTAEQKWQSVLSDVEAITTDLERKAKAGKNNQLFVDMKLTKHHLPAIEQNIKDVMAHTISHFRVDKVATMQKLSSSLSAIFTLSVRKLGAEANSRYLKEVNVKSSEDKLDCSIEGIVVVAGDRLVVADTKNVAVKLVDVQQNRVISRLPMSSQPFDVIKTSPTTVAVALGQERKIEILALTDVLAISRTINVPGDAFTSLCHSGDNFILVNPIARAVTTVNMSGKIMNTVFKDKDSDPIFKKPRYIALNRGQNTVYVTDSDANTVTTMSLKGKVIFVCRHAKLQRPAGVVVDRDGTIYVCSRGTHTIHRLSTTGQHMKILLDQQRELGLIPNAIAYDEDGDRLCVSSNSTTSGDKNYVRLLQLE